MPTPRRAAIALFASCIALLVPSRARADDRLEAPPVDAPAERPWHPNVPLTVTGGGLFAATYAVPFGLGAASIGGAVLRGIVDIGSFGLVPLFCTNPSHPDSKSYFCAGTHGAAWLAVPIVGPVAYVSTHGRDTFTNPNGDALSGTTKALLYASSVGQGVGLVLLAAGLSSGGHDTATKSATSVSPYVTPSSAGLRATLVF